MYLPGVGPNKKDVLNKELGVRTWGDLLEYYPYKYVDRSRIYAIHELQSDMPFVQIRGRILSFEEFEMSARKKRVVGHFSDGTGVADLVWFSGAQYIYKTYKVGEDYIVFGRPTVYGGRFQFSHPEIERASELQLSEMGMQPYYVTTEQMKKRNISSRALEKMVKAMLQKITEPIPETLPDFIVNARHLVSRDTALRCVHYPKNAIEMQKARERLKFEELFYVQLNILRYASDHRRKFRGYVFSQVGDDFHRFYSENLKFELTGAQKRVVHEIRDDMRSGRQMNRLLLSGVHHGAYRDTRRAALRHDTGVSARSRHTRRTADGAGEGQTASGSARRPHSRRGEDTRRNACCARRPRAFPATRRGCYRRAAPLRRGSARTPLG